MTWTACERLHPGKPCPLGDDWADPPDDLYDPDQMRAHFKVLDPAWVRAVAPWPRPDPPPQDAA